MSDGKAAAAAADQPEMDPLTEANRMAIFQFTKVWDAVGAEGLLPANWVGVSSEDKKILCYKFLVARQWDPAKAEEMLRKTCAFKKEGGWDTMSLFPCCPRIRGWNVDELQAFFKQPAPRAPSEVDKVFAHMSPCYQATYHYWDKNGHPIFIERTGRVKSKALVERYKQVTPVGKSHIDPCVHYHTHFNEVGGKLVAFNDKMLGPKLKRRVLGVTVILDCAELTYGTLYSPALDMLKACWNVDSQYYPEGLHRLYAVNCPKMIMFAYSIVKGWLDPRVQKKVVFVKPADTAAKLLEIIDADKLPSDLGGTCSCEGGCVYTPAGDAADAVGDDTLTEELQLKAGSGGVHVKEITVNASDVVSWEFLVADERNVEFSAEFAGALSDEPIEIFSVAKVSNMNDRFVAGESGTVKLRWSNEYSWVRGKTVTVQCFVSAPKEEPQAGSTANSRVNSTVVTPRGGDKGDGGGGGAAAPAPAAAHADPAA